MCSIVLFSIYDQLPKLDVAGSIPVSRFRINSLCVVVSRVIVGDSING
jgi:hypothetical protein